MFFFALLFVLIQKVTKKSRHSQGVCRKPIWLRAWDYPGTAARLRFRHAPCPRLFWLQSFIALGRLRHSTCPTANTVGMPAASNVDFVNKVESPQILSLFCPYFLS